MITPAKSLSAKLSAISRTVDIGAVRKLRVWLKRFGDPIKVVDSEDGFVHTYYFETGEEFTVLDWGHCNGSDVMKSIKQANHVLQDDLVADYLCDTTLHAFYAQCVEYSDYRQKETTILAEFDFIKGGNQQTRYLPKPNQRAITLAYTSCAYGFSLYKKSM